MDSDSIGELYRYNDWATRRVIDVVRALPEEAWTREAAGSFKSVRELVWHVAVADWFWLQRWRGGSPDALPAWTDADLPTLLDEWGRVETERRAFLAMLTDELLTSQISFRYLSGTPDTMPLQHALLHVVNHWTYHRGQLASILRQVGAVPPATDMTQFWRESPR